MAKIDQLQAEVEQLKQLLAQYGIAVDPEVAQVPEDRGDYTGFGTEKHATLLGLVIVDGEGDPRARERLTYTSNTTDTTYMLEDEVTPFMTFPDPRQVAALVLRQKVSEFEAGAPPIFDGAPPLRTMGLVTVTQ